MFELKHISAGYGAGLVLRNVNLTVPTGSVVALLGPNGAGKTSLLRVASGLLAPSEGQVLLDGQDITAAPTHARAAQGVCHVPEGRGIFRALSVGENLRLQAPAKAERSAVVVASRYFPRLGERTRQAAGTLSGGEQQMLALAHAYLSEPSVVLLDELSMGLAPIVVDELFDYLHRLAAAGTSLLLVEQYVTRALALADYVYVLGRGEIQFAGEPYELNSKELQEHYLGEGAA